MPFSIKALFLRYRDYHFWIKRPGFDLFGSDGAKIGHVDAIRYGLNSVSTEGWTTADAVSLAPFGQFEWNEPSLPRNDVSEALNDPSSLQTGFIETAHAAADCCSLSVRAGNTLITTRLPVLSRRTKQIATMRLAMRFVFDALMGLPALMSYLVRPNLRSRQAAKRVFRFTDTASVPLVDLSLFDRTSEPKRSRGVTVVVPVFNALEDLKRCLNCIEAHTDIPWRLIIVDDASTDLDVAPYLQTWAKRARSVGHQVSILSNSKNLGFVGSVNRAFDAARAFDDHVVILNSDAFVSDGWASRLLHPIEEDINIGSVTPMSNNAELLNVPALSIPHDLAPGVGDEINHLLLKKAGVSAYQDVPTGVGFCMALNKRALRSAPEFDEVFGKGYGEEVDWCLRTQKLGFRHVVQPAVFVEHKGAASFGSAAKKQAIKYANALISKRYPHFPNSVQTFIDSDPLLSVRLIHAITMAVAKSHRHKVFIAHSMGGGAEMYLQGKINKLTAKGQSATVLRTGGVTRWQIEHHSGFGCLSVKSADDRTVLDIFKELDNLDIIYSCAVGHPEPLALPEFLRLLASPSKSCLTFLFHDYFCVSEAYTLLNAAAEYTGVSPLGQSDLAWREKWLPAISRADQLVCFSKSSRKIVEAAYPSTAAKIRTKPHKAFKVTKLPVDNSSGPIGVLGDIGLQKGARLVSRLSRIGSNIKHPTLVLIGRLDPNFALGSGGLQTGAYHREEISTLATKHRISCWLIPSIWPETFSYTTHEALSTGLPVFAFDIGAQADAVKQAANGNIMPLGWQNDPERVLDYINEVLADGSNRRNRNKGSRPPRNRGVAA